VNLKKEVSIVICGEAGQGIQSIEQIVSRTAKSAGYRVFSTSEFMSRIRGGSNSTEIRISSHEIGAYVDRIDILIPLNQDALFHLQNRISDETLILGEREILKSGREIIDIPFSKIASEAGSKIYANSVAVGAICGLLKIEFSLFEEQVKKVYARKGDEIVEKNIEAGKKGYTKGADLLASKDIRIDIGAMDRAADLLLMSGADAVAFGAIAGGCNFIASYPMSPSTAVLTLLAGYSHAFDSIVEQAEDEIAAINMALGASYAGARAMVTTSGGGFALMAEGISLAGMLETPVVIHLGQRPGPATGLPTRTEQADLELALYAGHGEFPRAIFAPGTVEQAFSLTHRAFGLADTCQVPVVILTDQYFIDSNYAAPPLDLKNISNDSSVVNTSGDYKRYVVTASGVSPRGIPGNGEGLVRVDSDEHTEEGLITESGEVRKSMVEKRMRKLDLLKNDCVAPTLIGPDTYSTLVVCWGSNFHAVKEALFIIGRNDMAALHFSQVYPLHTQTADYLNKAKRTILVENNATGQFGKLIKLATGLEFDKKILKYTGAPFSVEELVRQIVE